MRFVHSPALHFIIIGALIFTAALFTQGALVKRERSQIVISKYAIDVAVAEVQDYIGRPPTDEEYQDIVDSIVNQEVLYRYALSLGMHKQPVVEERLSKIARFVEENPHEPKSKSDRALDALNLGLHDGDIVVRRILIDGAKRLIRAAVLLRVPSNEMVKAYIDQNEDNFMVPQQTRIAHITVNELKYGEDTKGRAAELLKIIKDGNLPIDEALALEDKVFVESQLPLLTDKELQRKFGYRFTNELQEVPIGEWHGPIPSRYGMNIVYVFEREDPYVPPLENIRQKVEGRLLHKLADEWLDLRLEQLKQEYDIVVQEERSS